MLSSDYSDHAPLLLQLQTKPWAKPRFHFEAFWVHLDDSEDIVSQAWVPNADACRVLDVKLRRRVKALTGWSMRNVGSVRLHLFIARELIAQFDKGARLAGAHRGRMTAKGSTQAPIAGIDFACPNN